VSPGAKIVGIVVVFFLALALQSTLIPLIGLWSIVPDLPLMVLFAFCISFGMLPGIIVGFFYGLLQDVYSASYLGQHALCFSIVGFVFGAFNDRVMKTDLIFKVVLVLLGVVLHDIIYLLVDMAKHNVSSGVFFSTLLKISLPQALYSSVLFLGLYQLVVVLFPTRSRY